MKQNIKRGILIAASAAAIASLSLAAPALAHDRGEAKGSYQSESERSSASLSATITSIPSTVVDAHAAHRGAYFTIYKLDSTQTSLPNVQPSTAGKRVGVHPAVKGSPATIVNGTLTGVLKFHEVNGQTVRYAVYPSSGGAGVLVTVVTDANGVATATSSAALTTAYSQSIADAASNRGEGKKLGHRGDRRGSHR